MSKKTNNLPRTSDLQKLLSLYQSGSHEEAKRLALSISQKFPAHSFSWKVLGALFSRQGQMSEALIAMKKAVRIDPQDAEAHNNLGILHREMGQLKRSEASLKKSIFLDSKLSEAHKNLGNTLEDLDRLIEAENSYRKAISLNPNNAEIYTDLGGVLKTAGKLKSSENNYRKAILLNPKNARAHNNLGVTLEQLGKLDESALSYKKAISLKPDYAKALWNLSGLANNISEAEHWINKCLLVDAHHEKAKLNRAALKYYQGDKSYFEELMLSGFRDHSYMRSFDWAFGLPKLPKIYFNRFHLFNEMINQCTKPRPFYEFGVWRGISFRYLVRSLKKGYGFDTFTGLPEDWDTGNKVEKSGTYTNDGNIPSIKGGEFIVGKYEDTLPVFFSTRRPLASIINFDADLYSSTICALKNSRPVIDENTILIFDEFIMNESWEQDE